MLIKFKYVVVHNPETLERLENFERINNPGADIIDYPIAEAKRNSISGDIYEINNEKFPFNYERVVEDKDGVYRNDDGKKYINLEWSIRKGEILRFPEYVANILKNRFPFLTIKEDDEKVQNAVPN